MTNPTFASTPKVSGSASGTNHTVNYHTTGESPYSSGDLLLLIGCCDGSSATIDMPAGDFLTNVMNDTGWGSGGLYCSYAISDGTENDGSFTATTTASESTTFLIIHITNWHGTTPPESEAYFGESSDDWAAGRTSTPSWDSTVDDTMWLSFSVMDGGATTFTDWPPNMADNNANYNASANSIGIATHVGLAASFTGAEQLTALSTSDQHAQVTLAIRGASISVITIEVPNGPVW